MTVIEDRVHRSSARKAKLGFFVALAVAGFLSAIILADHMHPILAFMTGGLIGSGCGAITWFVIRTWVVIRVIWWWLPEIFLGLLLLNAWVSLAHHTNLLIRLLIVAVVVGVPAAIPFVRQRIIATVWCLIVRHRLRVAFSQFIVANRSGSLPFIGMAWPTPVGERITVRLRPGLSLRDLEGRLDKLAVTCWAKEVTAAPASAGNSATVRIDVRRRSALNGTVVSPLVDVPAVNVPNQRRETPAPTALDLPDVTIDQIPNPAQPQRVAKDRKAPRPNPTPLNGTALVAGPGGDDISDFID